jgi:superfamily II DNA or RNA helicase
MTGLVPRILPWAATKGYTIENRLPDIKTQWSDFDTEQLIAKYPSPHEIRDYQRESITWALQHQRCVILSPTASGKSLSLYYIVRARLDAGKVILIVPTLTLVNQLREDFRSYGWSGVNQYCHTITGGVEKDTEKPLVISTWQSLYEQPAEWFSQFESVIGDEAHTFKADSLRGILEKMPHCSFRVGTTGTLDNAKSHKLSVEGSFGKCHRVAKTSELQTQGFLAPIKVQAHMLQYSTYDRWVVSEHKRKYTDEIDFIVQHPQRMEWLINTVSQLPGNVLVLFQYVEKHGIPIFEALKKHYGNKRPLHFISGVVSGEDRENIRSLIETQENGIIVASSGCFAVGINIKRLHHIVFSAPSKSKYRVLQSIGRGLRLHETKRLVYVHDLVDDFREPTYVSFAYRHWKVRQKFYMDENFPVEIYQHELETVLIN